MKGLADPVAVAEFGAPHGTRGEIRLKPLVEDADVLLAGPLTAADGRTFTITDLRPAKTVLIARVRGLRFRDEAARLNRLTLHVERAALPPPDEGEFAAIDLIGCAVVDEGGERLGRVRSVPDFGAGDLLEIEDGNGTWFLDFTLANVPEVDLEARRVTVRVPGEVSERDETEEDASGVGEDTPEP